MLPVAPFTAGSPETYGGGQGRGAGARGVPERQGG
jgi:hypothetical protein